MTPDQEQRFHDEVMAFLATNPPRGHEAHAVLDRTWTRIVCENPESPAAIATMAWMAHIEGDHVKANTYPLGAMRWRARPLLCKLGLHDYRWDGHEPIFSTETYICTRCKAQTGGFNTCP